MTRKNKNYNNKGPYLVKTKRVKNDRKICPICAKCLNKDFCRNRKDLKLMNKCTKCHNCNDKENCDKFYITEQYSITIVVGIDEETGEKIRKKFTGKTMNEAIYNSEKFKKDNPGGIKSKPQKDNKQQNTIETIIENFIILKNNNGTNNNNTYRTYIETLKRIEKNSGNWYSKTIEKIDREDIENFFNYEREKGYSQSTLKKDYQMLKQAFGIAKERKFIENNFFEGYYGIKMPQSKVEVKKVKAFDKEDLMKLLEYLFSPEFKFEHRDEFLIAILIGLRIGEVLALEAEDIDFEKGILHIRRTTTLDKNGHTVLGTTTKTPSGKRDIPLTDLTKAVLEHAVKSMKPNKNNLLFCNAKGEAYTDNALNSCLKRICNFLGIEDVAHNHKLRHSFSTYFYSVGTDYKVMEETMGHSDIKMTMDRYTDLSPEIQRKALQKYTDSVKLYLGDSIKEYTKDKNAENSIVFKQ